MWGVASNASSPEAEFVQTVGQTWLNDRERDRMIPTFIPFERGEAHLDWLALTDAMVAGHGLARAEIADTFLYRGSDTLLSRAAWIDGLGLAVKTATVFPENAHQNMPSIHGSVALFDDRNGILSAVIDFHLVTKWKTAADSLLAARRLARSDSKSILIVGAGTVAGTLIDAFSVGFPEADIKVWNRTPERALALVGRYPGTSVAKDLADAVHHADIILGATMTTTPVIRGDWLRPGQHVNLIGAYRPDMREVDDEALQRSELYVDSRETTLDHIGELKIPLEQGIIARDSVRADFYDLASFSRGTADNITLFKNGGGAHLDLMTARYILDCWNAAS